MTAGHSPWNRPRRTPRVHPASSLPWWKRLLKSWLAWLSALITAVVTATVATLLTNSTQRVVSSPTPQQAGQTSGKPSSVPVEEGLLDSSDLGGLNLDLKQTDLQIPVLSAQESAACGKGKLNPISAPAREFSESPNWFLTEVIEAFPSQGAAKQAYGINSSRIKCGYSPSTNISSQVSGLGDDEYAAEAHYSSKSAGLTEAAYIGVILSGRYVLILAVQTPRDNSFDHVSAFSLYVNAAVHKASKLPGA